MIEQNKTLTVYVNRKDKEFHLPEQLENTPIVIAVSPSYLIDGGLSKSPKAVENIKKALKRGCILGQRGGMSDSCEYHTEHDWRDRWHDTDSCPWHPFKYDIVRELLSISRGKSLLEETFNTRVLIYNPINHLFRENTLPVVQDLGFKFFMDRNTLCLQPYTKGGLTIIPEAKFPEEMHRKGSAIYFPLDKINDQILLTLLSQYKFVLPPELKTEKVSSLELFFDQNLKVGRKFARDFRELLIKSGNI